jgi:hypothetical protein
MGKSIDPDVLEIEIARLRGLDLKDLRAEWERYYGTTVPRTLRRDILVRSIVWQIQAKAIGGLKPEIRRYLRQAAETARAGAPIRAFSSRRIKAGTKLMRVWQGTTHTVTALADGFEWQGKRHRSLSEIARAITGTRWNGPVFFGVKPRPSEIGTQAARTTASRRKTVHA